jgi:Zn-dependent protease with chaperone function
MAIAWLYDGRSAARRPVAIAIDAGALELLPSEGAAERIDPGALFHAESRADAEVYGRSDVPGWRLGIPKPVEWELDRLLPPPQVYGRWVDRLGLRRALIAGAAVSAAVVLLVTQLPGLLAPMVPESWERRFGNALLGNSRLATCAGPGGREALAKIAAKLSPDAGELTIQVANSPMVNAAALPGGNIVIFRELLVEAESPDEVAGVLAHEIAHIENRDVTQAIIRHYGLGIIIASLGGNTGGNINLLLAADYSRTAESRADRDAIAALRRANISPVATARFFERLAKMEAKLGNVGDAFNYISTHPLSSERRRRFLASAQPGRRYRPALTAEEWDALQDICHNDPGHRRLS